jgi:hypothetical protein
MDETCSSDGVNVIHILLCKVQVSLSSSEFQVAEVLCIRIFNL